MKPTTPRRPIALAFCLVALLGPLPLVAGPLGDHGDGAQRIDRRLERMARDLKLTPEQQTQVRTLIEEEHKAVDRLRQETKKRIDAVLTEAQRAERDQEIERRMERRLDRLADRLDLNAQQTDQIRTIFKERRDNPDLTRTQIRERIDAVLTEDQRKALAAMAERHGGRGLRGGPDRGPGPGPEDGAGPGPDPEDDAGPDPEHERGARL